MDFLTSKLRIATKGGKTKNTATGHRNCERSEPHIDELAGAFFWYKLIIITYNYNYNNICIHGQSIWSRARGPPVNAQRTNVRPAE